MAAISLPDMSVAAGELHAKQRLVWRSAYSCHEMLPLGVCIVNGCLHSKVVFAKCLERTIEAQFCV